MASQFEFQFSGVAKKFVTPGGDVFTAVDGVDLDIAPSTFTCLVGPSGCGKSTLLNMAAGLYGPSRGKVLRKGVEREGINTEVGYITQHETLLPWRTLAQNIALPLEVRKVGKSERESRVGDVLKLVGLERFADYYPTQLSGGMRQRAMLGRTLIYNPSSLLMDEPFGALDAITRVQFQQELLSIWEQTRKTVIFVTHDLDEALLLGDRVVVFGTRPGRIVHVEDVKASRPRNFNAIMNSTDFIEARARLWSFIEQGMGKTAEIH